MRTNERELTFFTKNMQIISACFSRQLSNFNGWLNDAIQPNISQSKLKFTRSVTQFDLLHNFSCIPYSIILLSKLGFSYTDLSKYVDYWQLLKRGISIELSTKKLEEIIAVMQFLSRAVFTLHHLFQHWKAVLISGCD